MVVAVLMTLIAAPAASAERAIGLRTDNVLVEFDTATPDFTVERAITGIAPGTTLNAIDVRPSDGKLYGVARPPASAAGDENFTTYTINPDTGAATLVGGPAVLASGSNALGVGWDFRPVADQIRLVTLTNATANDNARIDPATGALVGGLQDAALTPTPVDIRGVAYDRSTSPAPAATTLFGIDRAANSVVRIGGVDGTPSANGGVITQLAPLGVASNTDVGFDISPATGIGYASMQVGLGVPDNSLYRIGLTPGPGPAATLVGDIGDGDHLIGGLAILPGEGPKRPGGGGGGAPDTKIDKSQIKAKKGKANFTFSGSGGTAPLKFECALAKKSAAPKFSSCKSPTSFKKLKKGKYTFHVRAVDAAGQTDPSPATTSFKSKRKKKKR